jgi:MFS family permease
MNLTLTTYMIFQGLAPTVFGDFGDVAGRRPAYLVGFTLYVGACVGAANCDSFAALLVLRALQASGCASTIALGAGVVADIATSADRGVWMGWATSGPMVAPALAPVLGGLFTQFLGWRWIFWFLVILTSAFLVPFVVLFPETARNVVGNGSMAPRGWNMSLTNYLHTRRRRGRRGGGEKLSGIERTPSQPSTTTRKIPLRIPNPLNCLQLLLQKDVGLLLFFNSIIYCALYDIMASMPSLLGTIYNFNALQIGLCFIPLGIGSFLAPTVSGRLIDWNFRRTAHRINHALTPGRAPDLTHFPLEHCRIQIAVPCVALGAAAQLSYGWVLEADAPPLAAALVLMSVAGFAFTSAFNVLSVLLVDLYPTSPATATAANNLVRCLMGAGSTGVIVRVVDAMGPGWCFTLHAAVVVALSPTLAMLRRWGPGWRERRRMKGEEQARTRRGEQSGGGEKRATAG